MVYNHPTPTRRLTDYHIPALHLAIWSPIIGSDDGPGSLQAYVKQGVGGLIFLIYFFHWNFNILSTLLSTLSGFVGKD